MYRYIETDPSKYLPEIPEGDMDGGEVVHVNLNQPMSAIRELLSACSVSTRLKLSGPLIGARDIAHAKIKERMDAGEVGLCRLNEVDP